MDNWTTERIIKAGRIAVWIALLSFFIPMGRGFVNGFLVGSKAISQFEYERRSQETTIEDLTGISLITSLAFAFSAAAEVNGRTREKRITKRELGRKFTADEIHQAVSSYYDNPIAFPWFHILMVPQWGLRFHLEQGWAGIPKENLKKHLEDDIPKEDNSG